jgi:hypothetical protein
MRQKKIPVFPPHLCITDRRRNGSKQSKPVAPDIKDRRAKPKRRRRKIDPTTCERPCTDDDIVFMKAMDQYKRDNRRQFPTWSEVLEVLQALGYRQVAKPTTIPGLNTNTCPKNKA